MLRQQIITVTLQQIGCEEIGDARMPATIVRHTGSIAS